MAESDDPLIKLANRFERFFGPSVPAFDQSNSAEGRQAEAEFQKGRVPAGLAPQRFSDHQARKANESGHQSVPVTFDPADRGALFGISA